MNNIYNTLDKELRKEFGEKVIKLCLDGGFTCPNRDGTIGNRGCIFCGEKGSGEFTESKELSITEQIEIQKSKLSKKWKANKYIAYFQNFTNTYGTIDKLKSLYYKVLEVEGVVGLAIATRPDCLDEEVIELLGELNKRTYLWIEIGLQTTNEKTANLIRRGYTLNKFMDSVKKLKSNNIKVVTHIIFGLPYEDERDMLGTVQFLADTKTWGVKIHSLYIQKDTDLYKYYLENPFNILTREEYTDLVVKALEILPNNMVIHRLTGDGKRELLFEPIWTLDKLKVLSLINKKSKSINRNKK